MKLNVVGSGSKGNCYILEAEHSALIIECGMPLFEMKKMIDFNVEKIVGALITHEHNDHAKYHNDYSGSAINIYASSGTCSFLKCIFPVRYKRIENKKTFMVGEFKVLPFDVAHDAKEPFGFMIHHPEWGSVLFVTDTYYLPYKFPGLNHIIIEANYSDEIIEKKSIGNKFVRDRVLESHMSLENCCGVLLANDLTAVNNIVLIHLSDSNSDEKKFKSEVERVTGKITHIAKNKMTINL